MTIICAVRKNEESVIAADTRVHYGGEIIPGDNLPVTKITTIGDSLAGSSGWGIYDNILEDYLSKKGAFALDGIAPIFAFFMKFWQELHKSYHFVNDQCSDKESPFGDLDSKFLIVNRTGIYLVSGNMSVRRFEKYYAIGAGSSYSLGALDVLYETRRDAASIARRAVQSAIKFNNTCGGDIEVRKA